VKLSEEAQERALESDDLETLGKYLLGDIGSVRVTDIIRDAQVQRRTAKAMSRVQAFLASAPSDPGTAHPDADAGAVNLEEPRAPRQLEKAVNEVLAGEVWNGLAYMRRYIEVLLKHSHPELRKARLGAGQLITSAARRDLIPPEAVAPLRYAVGIANRAVHGEPVEVGIALEAIDAAEAGLAMINEFRGQADNASDLPDGD
jgi:hypothetical protein